MTLRILLVALVATLGLELPGLDELTGWGRSGREWLAALVAEPHRLAGEVEIAPIARVVEVGETALAGAGQVDLAFEATMKTLESGFSADLAAEAPIRAIGATPRPIESDPASRLERFSTAVRLTRQAVDAWSELIDPTRDADQDDSL